MTGNYNSTGGTVSDSIALANPTVSVTPYNATYDGNAHTAMGIATGVKGESLNGLNLSGTVHTNAGNYTNDFWSFTDVTGNYNNAGNSSSSSFRDPLQHQQPLLYLKWIFTPHTKTF